MKLLEFRRIACAVNLSEFRRIGHCTGSIEGVEWPLVIVDGQNKEAGLGSWVVVVNIWQSIAVCSESVGV